MLESDEAIVRKNPAISEREREFQLAALTATRASFDALLDAKKYDRLQATGQRYTK